MPVYGKGENVRDWLWVEDHARAIDVIFHKAKAGSTYNIGGHNEKTNLQVVETICELLDELIPLGSARENDVRVSYKKFITFVKDRSGHDRRYAIDASKIKNQLSWVPKETFESGIRKTVTWDLNNHPWWEQVLSALLRWTLARWSLPAAAASSTTSTPTAS